MIPAQRLDSCGSFSQSRLEITVLGVKRYQSTNSRSSHTTQLKIGTPVAGLPDAWRHRVGAGLVGPVSVYSG